MDFGYLTKNLTNVFLFYYKIARIYEYSTLCLNVSFFRYPSGH